ncbi:MAG: molybdopterin cofactor-binding domain-containing protein [Gemmataceae bacterium]
MNDQLPPVTEPERYEQSEALPYHFDLDRRDFVKALGGGLAVFFILGEAEAQPPGRPGRGNAPAELAAWLHIGETGQVTAFTGKVELGQNIRTSLSQAVAEELHLPVASVIMVMGDTDRTPFDAGTFGSQTTPQMSAQLRRAAAAAREWLIDLAAEKAKVERGKLTVDGGKVSDPASGQSFTFGELAKGQKLTKTVGPDAPVAKAINWKVAGRSVPKVDGRAIVTGGHKYTSDLKRPGMLHGKVLRPETLKATLASADLKPAQDMAGVTAFRDGDFVGVVAPTAHEAEQALAAIKAEWKPGPALSDKTLFEDLKKSRAEGGGGGFGGRGNANVGDVEKGLAAADHKLKGTYTIAYIAHVPLEPRAAVAEWADGKLTVWHGTQRPFAVKSDLARTFGIDPKQVRVIVPDTGAGYGGKQSSEAAIEAARLAKTAGKPVKLVWTRAEEFTWAYFRPAGVIDVSAGLAKDGTITAWDFHNYNSGGSGIRPPYDIANQRNAFHASAYPLRQGSYRALAATANHFARECHIDDLAKLVGMDPLEFRLKNLKDPRVRAVLEAAAQAFGWGKTKPAASTGYGLACGTEKGSYVATCAEVAMDNDDARVVRLVSAFECGAIVNPEHLKNQVEGAIVMGLGGALFEAIRYDGGKILNGTMAKYRVPRFRDTPQMETLLLDRKDLPPAGAGETPLVATAPAIGNAILQAVGKRLRSLPMAPNGAKV